MVDSERPSCLIVPKCLPKLVLMFVECYYFFFRYVYEHIWIPGDFVVYDNRSTIHSTVAYSGDRHLHLMGFKGKVGQRGVPIRVGDITADAADIETFWWKHRPHIQRPEYPDE